MGRTFDILLEVANIRSTGRADGHKVHPYSSPALLAFLGITCGKTWIIIMFYGNMQAGATRDVLGMENQNGSPCVGTAVLD